MVSDKEADRVALWLDEAVKGGARILIGGERSGRMIQPTVLEDIRPDMKLSCMEAFGPIVTVEPFTSWQDAIEKVNRSEYGLQAGIFTRDFPRIFHAFKNLDVGGVIVNDVPTYRMDSMPYGGVKQSGLGREGVRYAVEEMTEIRLMAVNLRPEDVESS
jgi:acyl-CoA reductase-like NAD-dependent aldehyde dehydrogenase